MIYLLDSDILIEFFKLREPAKTIIQQLNLSGNVAISTVTITELLSGVSKSESHRVLEQLYNMCIVKEVNSEIAEKAGKWRNEYKTRGIQLSTPDMIIAATAYINNYCLVSNNIKDYPMPELNLYKNR